MVGGFYTETLSNEMSLTEMFPDEITFTDVPSVSTPETPTNELSWI